MKEASAFGDLPTRPAVYALYGGNSSRRYVAYVGIAENVRRRVYQHLMRRSSSIVTGAAAVSLNPELVTAIDWWEHERFYQPDNLKAAELVAFNVLNPVLRSCGNVSDHTEELARDDGFVAEMTTLLQGEPAGRFIPISLARAMERIAELEGRIERVEQRVDDRLNRGA